MPTLIRDNWIGWTPNSDDINGDPRGLLRCDNLTKDIDNVISLIRGTKIVSNQLLIEPTQIYAKIINLNFPNDSPGGYPDDSHVRYVASGNRVLRNYSPTLKSETAFDLGIVTTGAQEGVAFGFGFGHVFITAGAEKWKDDGITRSPLGMGANFKPGVSLNAHPEVKMRGTTPAYTEWNVREGGPTFTNTADYVLVDTNTVSNRAVVITLTLNINAMILTGPTGTGTGRDDDVFVIYVRISDTSKLVKVRVEYLMQSVDTATDYYYYEWIAGSDQDPTNVNSTYFNPGINSWTTLQCFRSDFQRYGTDGSVDWKSIRGSRITVVSTSALQFLFTDPKFQGGSSGPLTGTYEYIQVDVQNNGFYQERSLGSPFSDKVSPINASVRIFPTTVQPQANECWIFRRGGNISDNFYRISVQGGAKGFTPAAFNDTISDDTALLINIKLDPYQANLPDGIIGIETNFKGRNWYLTYERIYPSYRDNVSSYDYRYVIDTFGNTEYNLFITKVSTDAMILATNRDFYEISGSAGVIIQDNIEYFDLVVKPLGIKSPTISKTFAVHEGNLFYRAADGIRVLAGTSCTLLTTEIDLLFRGYNRHGIAPTKNLALQWEYLGVSNNQLYFSCQQTDNKRALYVFDLATKIWRYEEHGNTDSIQALFVEEDGGIIYSTASFGDKFVRKLDVGTLFNETQNINFKLLTPYDHNGQPRTRKDSYTLKIIADSGNVPITIILRGYHDYNAILTYTTTATFPGRTELIFDCYSSLGTPKSYQLEISGIVPAFKLYNFSVDYDARPEQLTTLRIPPSNFGIAGRKRLSEIPMIIDTLGHNINFSPILDGIIQPSGTIFTNEKTVYNYLFPTETSAYNVGGILFASVPNSAFEFYELIPPREIELLPDPVKYKHVPYTNFGTTSRKRFIQYAIVIDTRGSDVRMDINIDGRQQPTKIINTVYKKTVIETLSPSALDIAASIDTNIGIDIGCTLTALSDTPFEFYGVSNEDSVFEKLPPKTKFLTIAPTNYGTAARKRIRTIPMMLNTSGGPVTFKPIVDGGVYPGSVFITRDKTTVLHYFNNIGNGLPFGIDYGGILSSDTDFEFYGLLQPENVETLPVGKKFDQFGPVEFSKVGKIREVSIKMMATGTILNFNIFASDNEILKGTITTAPDVERTYVISVPKGINPNIFRMEMYSDWVFHRFDAEVKVNIDGAVTANKRIKIK
jgi:hypothetical protein